MAKWSLPIDGYVKALNGDLNKAARAVSLDMFTRCLARSPVDTGRFRGNWMIGVNIAPQGSELDGFGAKAIDGGNPSANGASALARSQARSAVLVSYQLGDQISIRNNLPYSVRLEKGWSQQAPTGVVAVTIAEFGGITAAAARKIRAGSTMIAEAITRFIRGSGMCAAFFLAACCFAVAGFFNFMGVIAAFEEREIVAALPGITVSAGFCIVAVVFFDVGKALLR